MRGNWGIGSWKIVVNARCAGSLQAGLLERKVHTTNARQRALQHWDFETSRISFSLHIQTKGFQQRPPAEKSLKLASCQTRPVASLFWQRFCSYPKCIFLGGGGSNVWGDGHYGGGGGGNAWLKTAFPATAGTIGVGRGGVNVWSKEGGGKRTKILDSGNQKAVLFENPQQSSSTIACTEFCFAPGWLW